MFDKLKNGLSSVFDKFFSSQITEKDFDNAMREFKILLLESDVALSTIKYFINNIKEKCIGQEIFKNFNPKKMIKKIVHDELISILDSSEIELKLLNKKTNIIMLCGLQGSGKTSTCAKIARFLMKQKYHNVSNFSNLKQTQDIKNTNANFHITSMLDQLKSSNSIDDISKILSNNLDLDAKNNKINTQENINLTQNQNNVKQNNELKNNIDQAKEQVNPNLQAQSKKILLVSLDIYRPAAQLQLEILANQIGVDSLSIIENQAPLEICKRALAKEKDYDIIIFDTAGRLSIDEQMMLELQQIEKLIKPTECLFVVDCLMGQSSVKTAETFATNVNITGAVMTRIDSDAKGGASISIKHILNKPIKFLCKGEKVDDIEIFKPDRIVSRIMDMGDIQSLLEQMQNTISEQDASKISTRIMQGKFSLEDYLMFVRSIGKFGGLSAILGFLPGASDIKNLATKMQGNESSFKKHLVIMQSMTKNERNNPKILNASRKIRISKGSGTKVEDINLLLKQYFDMEKMVKQFFGSNSKISSMMKNFM